MRLVFRQILRTGAATLLALLGANAARAQFVGMLGLASQERYRGAATDDVGPVLRASVMADSPWPATAGAYAGVSGLWRTRDGGLSNADAMVGWSGRLNALAAFDTADARWGWDLGVHRMHWGDGARYDFSEAMAGLLAPGASARLWYSPHYFGGPSASVYGELDADHEIDEHWRLFGHVGLLRYSSGPWPRRTDANAGADYVAGDWDWRLARDGIVAGRASEDIDSRRRGAAWVLSTSVAF